MTILFLIQRWYYFAIGALLILLGVFNWQISELKQDNKQLQQNAIVLTSQLEISQANLKEQDKKIQEQTTAIEDLYSISQKNAEKSKIEIDKAKARATKAFEYAAQVLKLPADPNLTACDNARKIITEELKRVGK